MQFNYIAGEVSERGTNDGIESGEYDIFGARWMIDF
jgi:hypothetical protein